MHLIVARSDGDQFRPVRPVLNTSTGTWSMPWEWAQAGSYRVFADFTTAGAEASALTLTRTVQVAGEFSPVTAQLTVAGPQAPRADRIRKGTDQRWSRTF